MEVSRGICVTSELQEVKKKIARFQEVEEQEKADTK